MLPKRQKGFTLIELLVVMTIIGILAGLTFVGFLGTRASTRDTKRRADLEQMRSALEVYRSDYGGYPPSSGVGSFNPSTGLSCNSVNYIGSTADPLPGNNYVYIPQGVATGGCGGSGTGFTSYTLCARLENTPSTPSCTTSSCGSAGSCNTSVTSP